MSFGEDILIKEFTHHSGVLVRLNNGSFGACPKAVLEKQNLLRDEWLINPDDFWHNLPFRFKHSTDYIAERLIGNVRKEDVVVLDSLTVCISLVVHSVFKNLEYDGRTVNEFE